MKKSTVVPIRLLFTKSRLSSELGIDRKRVVKLMSEVPSDGQVDNRYQGWYLSTACPVLYGLVGKSEDGEDLKDPDDMHPKDRKDWYDGEQRKRKIALDAGEVIPFEEVLRESAILVSDILQPFENLPDIFERDLGFSAEAIRLTQETIDRVRQDAYERVRKPSKQS